MIPQTTFGLVATVSLVIFAGILVGGWGPMSLATDVGLTDEEVCSAVQTEGHHAVRRLKESGFPKASTSPVEIYRLTREGTPEAAVRIDWQNMVAECMPLTYTGPVTADLQMSNGAYRVVVGELRSILTTGTTSGGVLGDQIAVWWGTSIHIPENEAYGPTYKTTVAKWAAGRLAEGI